MRKNDFLLKNKFCQNQPLLQAGALNTQLQMGYCRFFWAITQQSREDEGRVQNSHTWASFDENYLKSIFGAVILRGYFKDETSLVS